jgi:hypothetical protein
MPVLVSVGASQVLRFLQPAVPLKEDNEAHSNANPISSTRAVGLRVYRDRVHVHECSLARTILGR